MPHGKESKAIEAPRRRGPPGPRARVAVAGAVNAVRVRLPSWRAYSSFAADFGGKPADPAGHLAAFIIVLPGMWQNVLNALSQILSKLKNIGLYENF